MGAAIFHRRAFFVLVNIVVDIFPRVVFNVVDCGRLWSTLMVEILRNVETAQDKTHENRPAITPTFSIILPIKKWKLYLIGMRGRGQIDALGRALAWRMVPFVDPGRKSCARGSAAYRNCCPEGEEYFPPVRDRRAARCGSAASSTLVLATSGGTPLLFITWRCCSKPASRSTSVPVPELTGRRLLKSAKLPACWPLCPTPKPWKRGCMRIATAPTVLRPRSTLLCCSGLLGRNGPTVVALVHHLEANLRFAQGCNILRSSIPWYEYHF
jgi:hypothetical protein